MAPNMFTNTEEGETAPTTGIRPRQPDNYYGQRDFLLLGNWIFSIDQYFILTDMPIHKQGPFISTLLRDEALLWYRANYENWDPAVQLTWPTLRATDHSFAISASLIKPHLTGDLEGGRIQQNKVFFGRFPP